MGYKAFMMAIQNQISVLTKILATKIQQQQILEHQQAVTAKLSKAVILVSPQQIRSRKSSNETSSQCGSNKEKIIVVNNNINTANIVNNISPNEMMTKNNNTNDNVNNSNINNCDNTIDNVTTNNSNPIQSDHNNTCIIS